MSAIHRSSPLILVHLATGVQGSAVVRAALARGYAVRALTRDRTRVPSLTHERIEWVEADLDDAASLRAAHLGVSHAVLQVPIGEPQIMAARARRAAVAARDAGLRTLVLKLASASRPAPCDEPSFVGNALVEEALRQAGLRFASVRPTMYLDNLLKPSARQEIVKLGVFAPPIPASQRIAWTSADDCARAAIELLVRDATGDYRIAGPQSLSGDELSAVLSAGLGQPIVYRAQALDDFEQELNAALGAGAGKRVASKFRYFASHPEEAERILAQPFDAQAGLTAFQPLSVLEWMRAHSAQFQEEAAR